MFAPRAIRLQRVRALQSRRAMHRTAWSLVAIAAFAVLSGLPHETQAHATGSDHLRTLTAQQAERAAAARAGRTLASWYGEEHHGKLTASGEPFDMWALTAAHPTLPFG